MLHKPPRHDAGLLVLRVRQELQGRLGTGVPEVRQDWRHYHSAAHHLHARAVLHVRFRQVARGGFPGRDVRGHRIPEQRLDSGSIHREPKDLQLRQHLIWC